MSLRYAWKNYSLSITLATLFILSWLGQFAFQWQEVMDEKRLHGKNLEMTEFFVPFLSATFENWQSEFLQLFSMVVLTSFLVHKGSKESKDSEEKMQQAIERIEKKMDRLGSS